MLSAIAELVTGESQDISKQYNSIIFSISQIITLPSIEAETK
jgi:hypothetical protein